MTNSFDGKATPEAVEVTTSNLGPYEDLAVDSGLDTAKDKPTASAAPDPQLRVDGYEIDSPAQAYPPHTEEEIAVLMDSIRADGQIETAILHEVLHANAWAYPCSRSRCLKVLTCSITSPPRIHIEILPPLSGRR